MAATSLGRVNWTLKRSRDGHRDYNLRMLVQTDNTEDGPAVVYTASGLPAIGAPWIFGNDNDANALCSPESTVTPVIDKEKCYYWLVDIPFTTRPMNRCQTSSVSTPILEPMDVSGSFVKYVKQAQKDRFGAMIKSSSHEVITGIEKDANRPSVVIRQNVASLDLPTFTAMIDTLNDATLWGLAARKIKLSNAPWQRKYYGTCTFYYVRTFEFDIRFEGFDISDAIDKGFHEFDNASDPLIGGLYPDTAANRANPTKYRCITDGRGNPTPIALPLNGNGSRLTNPLSPVYLPTIQLYGQSNFLALGIPTTL